MNYLYKSEYTEKNSRFLTYLVEVKNKEEHEKTLESLSAANRKARHILFAARIQNAYDIPTSISSEDREPVSSMKKLAMLLEKKNITRRGIYIVRYFGGTKLGASRLDHVYFTLATNILKAENQ